MTENYFFTRRSCRNFKSDQIEHELVHDILKEAVKAPTCGNMQLYSIITTQDKEQKEKLVSLHYNQPAAATSPLILTICADFKRFSDWCKINDANPGYDNFHSFLMAMTDAVILAQQITTIAELKGLGTCYLGTVTYNAKQISELLNLPELVIPVVSLAIGWPETPGEETLRLPLDAVIHQEKYHNDSKEEIQKWFAVHDDNPENHKYIQENNKKNLAQVFAEVRYPKEVNENITKNFLELLKAKDFIK